MIRWVFLDVGNVIMNDDPVMAFLYAELHRALEAVGKGMPFPALLAEREADIAALNSAVSVYYYFRVLVALYMRPATRPMEYASSVAAWAVIALCALGVLGLGILPDGTLPGMPASLIGLVREAVAALR